VVLEQTGSRRGPVATVLVQDGTLRASDNFVVGNVYGKVRAMFDDRGAQLERGAALYSRRRFSVWRACRRRAISFVVVADRDKARGISEYREQKAREAALAKSSRVSLEGLAEQLKTAGNERNSTSFLRATLAARSKVLVDLLSKLSNDKVRLKVLRSGVARSQSPMCCWRRHRMPSSLASTCDRNGRRRNCRPGEGRHPLALDHLRTAG